MGLKGKLVSQISIKSKADVFKLYKFPSHLIKVAPQLLQNATMLAGQMGEVGSIIYFNYAQDGKKMVAKDMVEALDEKNKSITYTILKGNLLDVYNAFKITCDIISNGLDNMITYVLEYKKKSEVEPDPYELMEYFLQLAKEIERNGDVLVPIKATYP